MDWPSLLAGLMLGILGNLLTPSVRLALLNSAHWATSRVSRLSDKGLRLRLGQLEQEHTRVSELKNDLAQLIGLVMQSVMAVLFVTWVIIVMVFFLSSLAANGSEVPKYWYGAIGGIVGIGTRWLINALAAWSLVDKVRDFAKFEKQNLATREQINGLLKQLTGRGDR